jgi:hypothetical protein
MTITLFDSDGNPIAGPFNDNDAAGIGSAIVRHYQLVDDTTRLNRELGIADASEPFITIVRGDA